MSRGVTLLELVLATVVVGLLAVVAVPTVRRTLDWAAVEQAATDVANAHWAARALAAHTGRWVSLRVARESVTISVRTMAGDSLWALRPGPARRGVEVVASRSEVVFGPTGLGWGAANTTIRLSRGGASAVLVTSRLGRLRRTE